MEATRPPPSTAPPPLYVRAVGRVYRRSLRPVIFFTCGISLIWSLVLGVRFIRSLTESGETSKMRVFDIVLAVLFFVVAGIEVFGIVAAFTQRIVMARTYFLLSSLAAFITFGTELLRLIAHFVLKQDLINACANDNTGDTAIAVDGTPTKLSNPDATAMCQDDWSRDIWFDIGWLIVSTILAFLFASLAAAYYHQLRDPSFSRTTAAPSQAFRMGGWNQHPSSSSYNPSYPSTSGGPADPPFVPPYPGGGAPPAYVGGKDGYTPPEKEKASGDLGRGLVEGNESTATLQPVSLHDDPPEHPFGAEGRV